MTPNQVLRFLSRSLQKDGWLVKEIGEFGVTDKIILTTPQDTLNVPSRQCWTLDAKALIEKNE